MGDYKPDRPVFCGNFEYDAVEREIERLFDKYGPVEKIDMKTGFAFVYMKDKRDGEDAIRRLDGEPFGHKRRRLRVEWASKPEEPKRENVKPKTTLFVVNFDSRRVHERDLDHFFSRWGRLVRVQIKRNYAFIQYSSLADAQDALRSAHNHEFMGRRLSVEYVANDDPWQNERGGGGGGGRSRSPRRRSRSRSPYYGGRGGRSRSPVGRGRSPSPRRRSVSPVYRRDSPPARRESPPPRRSRSRSMSRSRSPPRRSLSR